jgi:hypothetical protein
VEDFAKKWNSVHKKNIKNEKRLSRAIHTILPNNVHIAKSALSGLPADGSAMNNAQGRLRLIQHSVLPAIPHAIFRLNGRYKLASFRADGPRGLTSGWAVHAWAYELIQGASAGITPRSSPCQNFTPLSTAGGGHKAHLLLTRLAGGSPLWSKGGSGEGSTCRNKSVVQEKMYYIHQAGLPWRMVICRVLALASINNCQISM